MGQVTLGLRNIMIKVAIFVVMAALLAWALGGTLFPRPHVARLDGVLFGDAIWYWQVSVSGPREAEVWWDLIRDTGDGEPDVMDVGSWRFVSGPIVVDDFIWFGGRRVDVNEWMIVRANADLTVATPGPVRGVTIYAMPDRLEVERQLARLEAGLPVQDEATIRSQRARVLDPEGE